MRLYAALFAIGLVVYGLFAWSRLGHRSGAPQYVFQADAWLHGHLSIDQPLVDNDWAKLETVVLDDGSEVRGRRLVTRPAFRIAGGDEIPIARVKQSRGATWYMSFPPLPTLLMLPSAAISGRDGNDVIPTLVVAALILPLAFALLRRLAAAGLSRRTVREDLWLVAALAFGSVLFFSAVGGRVWYTAQVVGVALALVYARASVEARRPIVAGIALGAAALTRPPIAFMFPLFVLEAWRASQGDRRVFGRTLGKFAAPLVAFALAGMIYNYVRFASPTEFGHTFLDVRQQLQIEQWGLASYHYLARNLAVAFTLLPEFPGRAPWLQIGGHGLAMWVTTPLLVYLVWPRDKPPIHRALWIAAACVALPDFLYMNSGWVQFGYRFSLDFLPLLFALVAIGGRPLGRVGKALIVIGIVVNTFGAITFDRYWEYYRVGGNAYDVVVPN
ncbi:MAG TPA: hypothetical protein VMJ10_33965 [Kofleriaceae bacterium]|nr:hypothetical protein [Kofleriaceae bacterium]